MFTLNFTIHGNPDRGQDDWTENHSISAASMAELRADALKFQGDNDIGGGNWGEATLLRNGVLVGYVSYNLRVWDKPYWSEAANEIKV